MFDRQWFGRHFFGFLCDGEDSGGGGGSTAVAEPAYEIPAGVPRDGDPQPPVPPVQPPATPPATPPAAPPAPTGGAPAGQPTDEQIPRYRLDEVTQQRDQFRALVERQQQQIDFLMQRFGQAPAPPPPPQPAAPQLSAQDIAIRDRMLAIIPELQRLPELLPFLEHRDAIMGAAEAVPTWRTAENQYWDRYANDTVGSIANEMATLVLGEGKTARDLDPEAIAGIRAAFTTWVTRDPSRAARYEREDPSIPKEFWSHYKARHFDPIRRTQQAALLTQEPPRVPQGGGGAPAASVTPPATPPANNNGDDDAIHGRAWGMRDTVTPR